MTTVAATPAQEQRWHRLPGVLRCIPATGWIVAILTLANAVAWGFIVPPFHVPDETAHAFYAQYLGETGKLPRPSADNNWYSADEMGVIVTQRFYEVVGESRNRPPADVQAQRALRAAQGQGVDRVGVGDASAASSNPPLYYLPQALVYRLARGLNATGRLALMRFVSALMAAVTAMCVFLFLRELLPGTPLAWTVGSLAAGLQPMFAFISSGVNNDAGLYVMSAALFLAVARIMRRGLTAPRALAAGLLLGLGVLVKTQMIAFAPGVLVALLVGAHRMRGRFSALRPLVFALAGLVPVLLYGILGATVWERPVVDRVSVVTSGAPGARPWVITEMTSYIWQLYLPRLPNLLDHLPAVPPYDVWFKGLVGRFGWLDYGFPDWVYPVAGGIWLLVAALALVELARQRATLRHRLGELASFGLMAGGLAAAIGAIAYRDFLQGGSGFVQARYLLPLLPLYALFPALAVRAVGPRRAPVVAVLLVGGILAHSLFAQLQTLVRFYG